ncbi:MULTISPECIES: hypothetical protein [Paenibacillus]|uniref:hypothetical protein n=1 Tax=Paenibacillus TaxID=44249 RepID=UPI00096D0327|nr:hypothetical protein [Paenibacillus odorifer]OME13993.1 hypothetical protein BSK60_14155 [Paenibacillus odorifer]
MWEVEAVRESVKASKLYMIGHREELFFIFDDEEMKKEGFTGILKFKIIMGEIKSPWIYYNIREELNLLEDEEDTIYLEMGKKLIRFTLNKPENVVKWFTPDIFLFLFWRDQIQVEVESEFDFRQFTRFELYYVGISKKGDSFSRLFEQAHHGRLKILSNAQIKTYGSRLTDELVIFLFDIDKTNINVISTENDIEEDMYYLSDDLSVIADAEKAFISLLKTEYNEVAYKNFPRSTDGLFNDKLTRYAYSIQEDLSFYTTIELKGAYEMLAPCDFILVEGKKAKVIKVP